MMKAIRFITAATAVLGLLASCQKENVDVFSTNEELVSVTLTASMSVVETKVTYNEIDNGSNYQLKPVWVKGTDNVIGFDENKKTYTFTVSEVDAVTGEAKITGKAPSNCTLHLIYLYGAAASSISSCNLAVDYANQKGDSTMPAVMLSDGTVTDGAGNFAFKNGGAVIGIKAVKGAPKGSSISKITINGENLSAATIGLNGSGNIVLTPIANPTDAISTTTLTTVTVNDDNGTLNAPVFIAVPAGAQVNEIKVKTDGFTYSYTPLASETLEANQYSYMTGQLFNQE